MKYMASGAPPIATIFSSGSATTARSRLPTSAIVWRSSEANSGTRAIMPASSRPRSSGGRSAMALAPLGELLAQVVIDLAADDAFAQAAGVLRRLEADRGALELAVSIDSA